MNAIQNVVRSDIGTICDSGGSMQLSMWKVDVPPGERPWQRHNHIQFEISYVICGSGVYRTENQSFPMLPGDLFVFSSNEFHHIESVGPDGLSIVNLHFIPQYIWGSHGDRMTPQNLNFCFSHCSLFQSRIASDASDKLLTLMHNIQNEFTEQSAEYALMIKSYLNTLLILLIRDYNYADGSVIISRKNLHSVRNAINYIDGHLTEPMTLSQIADAAKMSPNYFCKYFKMFSHVTVWEYINSQRINLAAQTLSNDKNATMLEIALRCGFNNTANFNKMFRKYTGMTPRSYRKSLDLLLY